MADWFTHSLSDRAANVRSPKFSVIAEVRSLVQGVSGVVDLGYGEPDFQTPEHIRDAAKTALDEGHTHYVLPVEGLTELRVAIAEKLQRENHIAADPATEILVTAGVQEAINVAVLTLVNPGDEVIMPDPYYYSDPLAVIVAGGTPVYTHLSESNDFHLDLDDIESKITPKTKAIMYINPNCPTGSVFPRDQLRKLAQLAAERHVFLITDEVYEKLVYDDIENTSVAALPEAKDLAVSMFGFSKAYAMTGWRIGFMYAPAALMRAMLEIHGQLVLCTNSIAQRAALAALQGPQECVEDMRRQYQARRDVLVEGLNRLGFRCRPPEGSFYIYANVSGFDMPASQLAKFLAKEARIVSYPGTAFTNGDDGERYLRFAYPKDMELLKEGLRRLEQVVGRL
jgi:aspartate/methionine/tyrosine aminotransferase